MSDSATTSSEQSSKATENKEEAIAKEETAEESESSGGKEKDKVAALEAEVDRLQKEIHNAQNLQSQADKQRREERVKRLKLEKKLDKIRSGEVDPMDEAEEIESSVERDMRMKAKMQVKDLLLENPKYQKVLEKDPTLKDVLLNNPFAIIGEYYDEQDAVDQIKGKLNDRVNQFASQQSSQSEKEEDKGAAEFEAGAVEPEGEEVPPEGGEESEQGQNLDEKHERSIKDKISKSKLFGA